MSAQDWFEERDPNGTWWWLIAAAIGLAAYLLS